MPEWGLLIWGIIYTVGVFSFSVALTIMVDTFMHYGHIWGGVRMRHAKSYIAKIEDGPSFVSIYELLQKVDSAKGWVSKMNAADELYWVIAGEDKQMRALICPVCIGTKISFSTCLLWGVSISICLNLAIAIKLFLIGCTPFLITPFVVWYIKKYV